VTDSENLDLVRSIHAALDRGAYGEGVVEMFDPAIVLDNSTLPGLLSGVYHGQDRVRQFAEEWRASFETKTYRNLAETFIDAGGVIVVGHRVSGRGKASGVAVEMHRWSVYRIRNGLVIRIDMFGTKAEALEAAGLSEDAHASS
jgi:ketosteroid isomerase-like protein